MQDTTYRCTCPACRTTTLIEAPTGYGPQARCECGNARLVEELAPQAAHDAYAHRAYTAARRLAGVA